ncbi:MAG: ABC transporter substrate-binding protein [Phototrophicaceae bacterium]
MKRLTLWLAWALTLATAPMFAQSAVNLTESCVTAYDAAQDYFPDKAEVTTAENLQIEYFNHYKVITVSDAFDSATPLTYVLVQCGTPTPPEGDFPTGTQFIEVPTGDLIAMSTTHLPLVVDLGLLDHLIGLDSFLYVNTPQVLAKIEAGGLIEIGSGSGVNVEVTLEAAPSLVLTYGYNPDTDAHPVLREAGIFTAIAADWREASPLGRAEWIKFIAAFYNAEAAANAQYTNIETAYNNARELAATIPVTERPTILWNYYSPYGDDWSIPGAQTYIGALIADAGGQVALGDLAPTDSVSLSFEAVYEAALDADVWVTNAFGVNTLDDLLAQDPRYADFGALAAGNVWNNSLVVNANGGNNYYELGAARPDLVLQDMVAIFHPDLLPDYEMMFHLRLTTP